MPCETLQSILIALCNIFLLPIIIVDNEHRDKTCLLIDIAISPDKNIVK